MHTPFHRVPRRPVVGIALSTFLLFHSPAAAHANAGTPLMWAGYVHLLFGNILLGLGEAALLAVLLRKRWAPIAWRMVLANYASMFFGFGILYLLSFASGLFPETPPLSMVKPMILVGLIVAFLVTVLVEWPFVAWAIGQRADRFRAALRPALLVQTASYAILVPLYGSVSPVTLVTETHYRATPEFAAPGRGIVYYIGAEDHGLWRVRTDGTERERLTDRIDGAYLWPKQGEHPGRVDLWARSDAGEADTLALRDAGPVWAFRRIEVAAPSSPVFDWRSSDFRRRVDGNAEVQTGFWASEGLAMRYADGTRLRFALETPFMAWPVRSATVLPEDQVVFQAGDQILILDLRTREIARIARGTSPIVRVLPREGS